MYFWAALLFFVINACFFIHKKKKKITKIVLHFVYRNDRGLFVIKYMEHWNGAVLTYAVDLVCYISKVIKLHALIIG